MLLMTGRNRRAAAAVGLLALALVAAPAGAENLALGRPYALVPAPSYSLCTDEGDLTQLSSDLVIAFTTTVVGLALGITSFFVHVVRRRWANEDIGTMEFATEILARPRNDE